MTFKYSFFFNKIEMKQNAQSYLIIKHRLTWQDVLLIMSYLKLPRAVRFSSFMNLLINYIKLIMWWMIYCLVHVWKAFEVILHRQITFKIQCEISPPPQKKNCKQYTLVLRHSIQNDNQKQTRTPRIHELFLHPATHIPTYLNRPKYTPYTQGRSQTVNLARVGKWRNI